MNVSDEFIVDKESDVTTVAIKSIFIIKCRMVTDLKLLKLNRNYS